MARPTQPVQLSTDDHRALQTLVRRGTSPARVQTRARVLDLLQRGHHPTAIATTLDLSVPTVFNIKRRYLAEGLHAALHDKPRSGTPRRIDGAACANITALACSAAPDGHARWTLRLLADRAVVLGFVDSISHNAVKEILKKTLCNPTARKRGVSARSRART